MVLGISAMCWNTTQVSLWGDAVSFPPNHPLSICPDKHLPPLRSVIPGCLHITVLRLISLKRQEKVHLPLETPTGMATFIIQPHVSRALSHLGDRDLTEEQLRGLSREKEGLRGDFLTLHNSLLPSPATKGSFPQL